MEAVILEYFHLFRNTGMITEQDIWELEEFIGTVKPLYVEMKTEIHIVPENETTCKRGGQFCLFFYSESKEGYLQINGLDFVIIISIAKMSKEKSFA